MRVSVWWDFLFNIRETMNVIFGIIGAVVGAIVAFIIQAAMLKKRTGKIVTDAEKEGESMKKSKILQAKERFIQLKEEHEKKIKDRERKLQSTEDRVRNKEQSLSNKIEDVNRKDKKIDQVQASLDSKIEAYKTKQQDLEKQHGFKEKPADAKVFFRKGVVGDWRTKLTSKQVDQVIQAHGTMMEAYGYL